MPRIGYAPITTVFYLYGRCPRTGELLGPAGTGVFVGRTGRYTRHLYAVTAYHVAVRPHGMSFIRLNSVVRGDDGVDRLTSRFIEFEPNDWHFIPNGDDLAAVDVTDELRVKPHMDFVSCEDEKNFVTPEFVDAAELGEGEDGFMIGLFSQNPGVHANMPALRFGNISQMAHQAAPIEQGNRIARPSHVFDMRSKPGFSGSPVFVYRTPEGDLTDDLAHGEQSYRIVRPDNQFVRLLGIHSGQFHEEIVAEKAEAYGQIPINEGDRLRIPSSMTIVVPAWNITTLLNLQHFEEQREMREKRLATQGKAIVRPEASLPPGRTR